MMVDPFLQLYILAFFVVGVDLMQLHKLNCPDNQRNRVRYGKIDECNVDITKYHVFDEDELINVH